MAGQVYAARLQRICVAHQLSRWRQRIGLRQRDTLAHRAPVAVFAERFAQAAHHYAHALRVIGRIEHGFEVLDARRQDLAEIAQAVLQALRVIPPGGDGLAVTPAREGARTIPVGDGDHVVVTLGVDIVGQVDVAGTVGALEASDDAHQCATGAAMVFRSDRLHPEVAHLHL